MAGDGTLCDSRLQAPSTCFIIPWRLLIKRKLKDKTTKNFNPTTTERETQVGGPFPSVEFWANILAVCMGSPGHITFKIYSPNGAFGRLDVNLVANVILKFIYYHLSGCSTTVKY